MDNRKKLIVLFSFLIFISTLTGCNQTKGQNTDLQIQQTSEPLVPKETLNFRITWKSYSGRGEAIKKIVENYNALNQIPYQVVVVDGDEDLSAIETLLSNKNNSQTTTDVEQNTTSDIFMLPYRYTQYLGGEHKLYNISNDFIEDKNLFYESLWQLGVVDGNVYGIPWMGHTMGLIYNKNLLENADINPKDIIDLDSLVKACEKVEAATDTMGIGLVGAEHNDVSWMVNQFIYGFGGSLVSEDGTKVTINSKKSKAALEFYKNILGAHAQATWKTDTGVEVMDAFREQKIAFEIQGLWGITDIWKSSTPFETGVISLDSIGLYPEVGPMMVALPANIDEQKRVAAVDFIHYLISSQGQEQILDGEYSPEHDAYYPFRIPVRKDSSESSFFKEYPEFREFLSGFSKPSIDVPVPLWQTIKDEYYDPGLHQVMENQITIEDFLKNIEEQGDKILNSKD